MAMPRVRSGLHENGSYQYMRRIEYAVYSIHTVRGGCPASGSGLARPTAFMFQQYPMALEAISNGFRETRRDPNAR